MGTNYYAYSNACPTCGAHGDKEHIGKSSFGWRFLLHRTERFTTEDDWFAYLPQQDVQIRDEYGDTIEWEWLMTKIKEKAGGKSHCEYGATRGTTCDLLEGEFS